MKPLSWKYKSIQRHEYKDKVIELFEWSGNAYVRVYGTGENFIDIVTTLDIDKATLVYNQTIELFKGVEEIEF